MSATVTAIKVADIRVGDIIEERTDTHAHNLATGEVRPVTDVRRYRIIKIGKWTTRLEEDTLFRFRPVVVQSVRNISQKRPVLLQQRWSDDWQDTAFFLVERAPQPQ